jgi:hypothetical protein
MDTLAYGPGYAIIYGTIFYILDGKARRCCAARPGFGPGSNRTCIVARAPEAKKKRPPPCGWGWDKNPSYMAARKHRHGVLAYVKRRHDMAAMKRRHGVLGHKA